MSKDILSWQSIDVSNERKMNMADERYSNASLFKCKDKSTASLIFCGK